TQSCWLLPREGQHLTCRQDAPDRGARPPSPPALLRGDLRKVILIRRLCAIESARAAQLLQHRARRRDSLVSDTGPSLVQSRSDATRLGGGRAHLTLRPGDSL